jgi:hypothetical protein
MHRLFWLENLRGRDHLKELRVDGKITSKYDGKVWIGFIWLRIGTSGGLL